MIPAFDRVNATIQLGSFAPNLALTHSDSRVWPLIASHMKGDSHCYSEENPRAIQWGPLVVCMTVDPSNFIA